jgi:hypothetical protein
MTTFGGAGTGQLMGEEFLLKRKKQEADLQRLANQDYYSSKMSESELERNKLNNEKGRFELDFAKDQQKKATQEMSLMAKLFASGAPERQAKAETGQEEALAEKFTKLGETLIAIDPKKGMEYIKLGSDFKSKAQDRIGTDLEIKAKKAQVMGEVASFVTDDESAQAAAVDMAKLGREVPERFRNFSTPEAKEYWTNQKSFAKNYAVSLKADNDALKSLRDNEKLQMEREKLELKKQTTARTEELAKLRIAKGKASVKVTKDEVKREVGALNQLGEEVEDLPIETKRVMAEDVAAATVSILAEDPSLSQDEAKGRARELIKSRIVDGQYPLGSKQVITKPSFEQFLPAAMKANPGLTEAEIKDYYLKKYGK